MKKILLIISVVTIPFITTACSNYLSINNGAEPFYGIFVKRDMIHADVRLFQKNSNVLCEGSIFINAPSRSITMKNDFVDAKMLLTCNDGRLMDSDLKFRKASFDQGVGVAFDQYNNRYEVKEISKKEYKRFEEKELNRILKDYKQDIVKY